MSGHQPLGLRAPAYVAAESGSTPEPPSVGPAAPGPAVLFGAPPGFIESPPASGASRADAHEPPRPNAAAPSGPVLPGPRVVVDVEPPAKPASGPAPAAPSNGAGGADPPSKERPASRPQSASKGAPARVFPQPPAPPPAAANVDEKLEAEAGKGAAAGAAEEKRAAAVKPTRLQRVLKRLDPYGDQVREGYDARKGPRTACGSFTAFLVRAAFVALIVWNATKLFSFQQVVTRGDGFSLEAGCFGAGPGVPMDSFEEEFQFVESDNTPVAENVEDQVASEALHAFDETIKAVYKTGGAFQEAPGFFNHSAHLFVRFRSAEIEYLLPCMLQVALYNKGVYLTLARFDEDAGIKGADALEERAYHDAKWFPSLVTSDGTFLDPSNFEFDPKREGTTFAPSEKNVVYLHTRLDQHVMEEFVASTAWGPQAIDITKIADARPEPPRPDGRVHLEDFLNYELSISYVTNMNLTAVTESCDDYDLALYAKALAIDDRAKQIVLLPGEATYNFPLPFYIQVVSFVDDEKVKVTAMSTDAQGRQVLTIERETPYNHMPLPQAKTCAYFAEYLRIWETQDSAPEEWVCEDSKYWNDDGCDCNCGAFDPDCCDFNTKILNCRDNQWCSVDGDCTQSLDTPGFNVDPNTFNMTYMRLSQPCERLVLPGEPTIIGFIGTEEKFNNITKRQCVPCTSDPLYEGDPKLNEKNEFVCNALPEARLDMSWNARNIWKLNPATGYVEANITINNLRGFPFPLEPAVGFPYPILVWPDAGPEQPLEVLHAYPDVKLRQVLHVRHATPLALISAIEDITLGGFGRLLSAIDPRHEDVIVEPFFNDTVVVDGVPLENRVQFPRKGPYKASTDGEELGVSGATNGTLLGFQILYLSEDPPTTKGNIVRLTRAAEPGDTAIYTTHFDFTAAIPAPTCRPKDRFPLVIRGLAAEDIEIRNIKNWTVLTPGWTCDPYDYAANDGICDCNCGMYDPDCGFPSPAAWEYTGRNTNCPKETPYCCFDENASTQAGCPAGTRGKKCVAARPTNTSMFFGPALEVKLDLDMPLQVRHDRRSEADTAFDMTSICESWLGDDEDGEFWIYTQAPVIVSLPIDDYLPSERNKPKFGDATDAPETLEVDVSLFIVPDRRPFPNVTTPSLTSPAGTPTIDLCPTNLKSAPKNEPIFDAYGWSQWRPEEKRQTSIGGCSWETPDATGCVPVRELPKNSFNIKCIREMPVTRRFRWQQTLPVNNKWIQSPATPPEVQARDPFYVIDTAHQFFFTQDEKVKLAEDLFAENQVGTEDLGFDDRTYIFYGQAIFQGTGNGTLGDEIPANLPYLYTGVRLRVSDAALEDVLACQPVGYPRDREAVKQLLARQLQELRLTWQLDDIEGDTRAQSVVLQPGYAVVLTAKIEVYPVYSQPLIGSRLLSSWEVRVVSQTVSRQKLDYFRRNIGIVRHRIEFEKNAKPVVQIYVYTIQDFLNGIGAAAGILGLGLTIVTLWQRVTREARTYQRQFRAKEREEKERMKEEVKEDVLEGVVQVLPAVVPVAAAAPDGGQQAVGGRKGSGAGAVGVGVAAGAALGAGAAGAALLALTNRSTRGVLRRDSTFLSDHGLTDEAKEGLGKAKEAVAEAGADAKEAASGLFDKIGGLFGSD
eukprot:tig00021254_g19682.t1